MVVGSSSDLRVDCVYGRSMIGSPKMGAGFEYGAWKKLKRWSSGYCGGVCDRI
jgi:hypothetical protein